MNAMTGMTRREFVAAAGAAAAGAVVAPEVIARSAHVAGSDSIRVGLIGCGGRGTGACLQALKGDKAAMLAAMGDVFPDRLESSLKALNEELKEDAPARVQVPDDQKFTGFDAYQRVIDSDVDVVILTTYPHFRPAHLKAAVAAGKHVFAEKPIAVDAPGVRSVLASAAEAKAKNLAVMVGFCWRYNDGMRATFEQVNSGPGGAVGDVLSVHTTYHTGTLGKRPRQPEWSAMEFQMRNWLHFTWLSGDHIVEQAVHSVDRLCWAMGDKYPARVNCLGGRQARTGEESGNVYDHFAAVYEYADGRRAFHTTRQMDGCPHDNTDYVYGSKGICTINGWVPTYSVKDYAGAEVWKYGGPTDRDMYQTEHDELFASIRAGTPINDCERGAYSTLTALMARMSAYTGQTVTWEQALNSTEDLTPPSYEWGPAPEVSVAIPGKTKFV
jgi:predicted dehydrogenase